MTRRRPSPVSRRAAGLGADLQGAELLEQLHTGLDVALVGRVHEREPTDVAEPERGHLQDDRGQVGAQDLGVGELRAGLEVLLGVEPDADARLDTAAAALALVGGGLADRLDGEPLHLGAVGVARDPGVAGVDDVADARDRQRGLRDVGGEHDPSPGVRREDPVLLGRRQPREQRDHLVGRGQPRRRGGLAEHVGGVPDLPLPRQEDQDVAGPLAHQLLDRVDDRLGLVLDQHLALVVRRLLARHLHQRAVAHLHRVGPPRHLDDRRGRAVGLGEVRGELLGVDGRGGDHDLEVGPLRQQLLEVAEEEVDVEAALVGLVDDQRVVRREQPVVLELGQQDAVRHELDEGVLAGPVGEPDLVAHRAPGLAEPGSAELLGDPLGDAAGGDPARLGVPDHPVHAAAELEADLGQLGGLARPGLPRHDHDLVVADGGGDVLTPLADRQLGGVADLRHQGLPRGHLLGAEPAAPLLRAVAALPSGAGAPTGTRAGGVPGAGLRHDPTSLGAAGNRVSRPRTASATGGHLAAARTPGEPGRQPDRDRRQHDEDRGDDVDHRGLVGPEQVLEDPDRQGRWSGPAVKVVTMISSKESAKASSPPANSAERSSGKVT